MLVFFTGIEITVFFLKPIVNVDTKGLKLNPKIVN